VGGDDLRLEERRVTYQRAINLIFHDLLGVLLEVYIDDVIIKSTGFREHMADLRVCLERMKKYSLRMNPTKCAFGVSVGQFLGFVVHQHGIQIDPKKVESIKKIREPSYKKDVQKLLGKINYLRCFISNLIGKIETFLPLIRLKHEGEFTWGQSKEKRLKKIKEYLSTPPIL
jgi:hypothetical protein